jgi:hypothetical protein
MTPARKITIGSMTANHHVTDHESAGQNRLPVDA